MSRLELQRARRKIAELEYENTDLKKKLEVLKEENDLLRRQLTKLGSKPKSKNQKGGVKNYLTLEQVKEMIEVSPKVFTMGALPHDTDADREDETPIHQVDLTRRFAIGKYQVSQNFWSSVTNSNPSSFRGMWRPVEMVSWLDCILFCNLLSEQEGLEKVYTHPEGLTKQLQNQIFGQDKKIDMLSHLVSQNLSANGYRLPTEAEWEYSARAEQSFLYSGSNNADDVAWFGRDSAQSKERGNSVEQTHPVGEKNPNGFGLYDMSGNVWEWVWDWKGPYSTQRVKDPTGPSRGTARVAKGGCWRGGTWGNRVSGRYEYVPSFRSSYLGLRLARTLK